MNELLNAGFRYALVRLRDASAAVGLYRGENAERKVLTGRLSAVMDNYGNWRNRMVLFTGWNLSVSQAIDPLPFIVQAPRLFAREISLATSSSPRLHFTRFTTRCRSSATRTTRLRATARRSSGSTGWSTRTPPPARSPVTTIASEVTRSRSTTSACALRTANTSFATLTSAGTGRRTADQWSVGHRQDRPFAEPRGAPGRSCPACGRPRAGRMRCSCPSCPTFRSAIRAVVSYPHEEGAIDDREIQQAWSRSPSRIWPSG